MLVNKIVVLTLDVLSTLTNLYNQDKIDLDVLKQHTAMKLSFLKDVKNDIDDNNALIRIDKIINEIECIIN